MRNTSRAAHNVSTHPAYFPTERGNVSHNQGIAQAPLSSAPDGIVEGQPGAYERQLQQLESLYRDSTEPQTPNDALPGAAGKRTQDVTLAEVKDVLVHNSELRGDITRSEEQIRQYRSGQATADHFPPTTNPYQQESIPENIDLKSTDPHDVGLLKAYLYQHDEYEKLFEDMGALQKATSLELKRQALQLADLTDELNVIRPRAQKYDDLLDTSVGRNWASTPQARAQWRDLQRVSHPTRPALLLHDEDKKAHEMSYTDVQKLLEKHSAMESRAINLEGLMRAYRIGERIPQGSRKQPPEYIALVAPDMPKLSVSSVSHHSTDPQDIEIFKNLRAQNTSDEDIVTSVRLAQANGSTKMRTQANTIVNMEKELDELKPKAFQWDLFAAKNPTFVLPQPKRQR